jgi:outer membrane protein insertion porin family/translocation and assembly module TamA
LLKRRFVVFLALIAAFASSACLRKDYPATGPAVEDVELQEAKAIDTDEALDGLATAASPRFLGIWDGVAFDYEVYDEALLERDLARVQRYYKARGYHEASVTAARVIRSDEHHVRVEIRVHEGIPIQIREWSAAGLERADFEAAAAALKAVTLKNGAPFDEAVYETSKKALVEALGNRGYAFAKVKGSATVDLARHEATVRFEVTPGNKSVFGPVKIVGLTQIPERPVRANLRVREGATYSASDLEEAREALVNLGVFSTVDVEQDFTKPESGVVPITVVVKEAPLRTLRMGGGVRFDLLELSGKLIFGWEHRNFLGGMRKLKLEAKPGLVFFPTRTTDLTLPTHVLPTYRMRSELRQPSFIEGRTTGFVAAEYNIFPLLFPDQPTTAPPPPADPPPGFVPEELKILGYQEVRAMTGIERAFFRHHLYTTLEYNWQGSFPFAYLGKNTLDTIFASYPEFEFVLDFRDDPIDPRRGVYFSNNVQVAGYIFGGSVDDVRDQPELRTYVPISKDVVFASRFTVGFLFPNGYGQSLQNPSVVDQRDQQKLMLRAFYSGGPNSNRGYPFRGVGPHGVVGFLVPSTAACDKAVNPDADPTNPNCLYPLGGLTLWEVSLEVRFPIVGALRAVVFVDASDVASNTAEFVFSRPHLSPGIGLRYATPIGPIRLDVGYRVPYLQQLGQKTVDTTRERIPDETLGLPMAIQFGLGEAY